MSREQNPYTAPHESAPRRRWYQFSLSTKIIVATLLVFVLLWVAFSLNWIRKRRELDDRNTVTVLWKDGLAPAGLWLFGERRAEWVVCYPEDIAEAHWLFPEARIVKFD